MKSTEESSEESTVAAQEEAQEEAQYAPQYRPQYGPQYAPQYGPQYRPQYGPQYRPQYGPQVENENKNILMFAHIFFTVYTMSDHPSAPPASSAPPHPPSPVNPEIVKSVLQALNNEIQRVFGGDLVQQTGYTLNDLIRQFGSITFNDNGGLPPVPRRIIQPNMWYVLLHIFIQCSLKISIFLLQVYYVEAQKKWRTCVL